MSETSNALSAITALITEDAKSPYPKYPSQSFSAIQDEKVASSLSRRFAEGARLRGIRAFEYDFLTGLNRICFEFEAPAHGLGANDLLVLLDGNCRVIGLVDPFDSEQPNRMVPPMAALGGAMPFVLDRPSASANLPFDKADLAAQDYRARQFMARMIVAEQHSGGGGPDPCGPEAHTTTSTYCTFYVGTLQYIPATGWDHPIRQMDCDHMDTNADDCGIFPA